MSYAVQWQELIKTKKNKISRLGYSVVEQVITIVFIIFSGTSWCVEALRGYSGGGAGSRLELGSALAALRSAVGASNTSVASSGAMAAGMKVLQRLKAVARAHPNDRVLRAEANTDAAFVAYAVI